MWLFLSFIALYLIPSETYISVPVLAHLSSIYYTEIAEECLKRTVTDKQMILVKLQAIPERSY